MTKIRYRFPKFHPDWKEDEFKDIFDFHQTNTFSRSQMNNRREFTRNIHYGDILTKYGNILSDLQEVPYINKDISLLKFKEESYLQNGDIIIADTAEDLTVGKAIEVQNIDGKVLSGLHTILCRPKFKFAPRFLGYNLNSSSYRRNLIPLVVGVKVCSISKTNISKTLVMYPDDINEQQKIADCLSSIDDLIFAEEKKLSLLNDYKKGWVQKLFPAEGKTIPEWRFPEFILGDSIDYVEGRLMFDAMTNRNHNADLPILAITQEYGAIPRDKIDYIVFVTEKSLASYKVVEKGDFIISLRSFQGGIEYSMYDGICSPAYIILRKKINIIDQYYKYYFKSHRFIQDLNKNLEGIRDGKMVSYSQFSSILLPKPDRKEQQKIANFLSSIDDLINKQKDRIEALKQHKKALMQGLFPSIEEVCK